MIQQPMLVEALATVRKRIQQIRERKQTIGEENTKAILIEPVLSARRVLQNRRISGAQSQLLQYFAEAWVPIYQDLYQGRNRKRTLQNKTLDGLAVFTASANIGVQGAMASPYPEVSNVCFRKLTKAV